MAKLKIDPLGQAIEDYYYDHSPAPPYIHSQSGDKEMMPVGMYFRHPNQFPELEKFALKCCEGKILDVGAGAGSHTLSLQDQGKQVTALDISEKSVSVMKARGVRDAIVNDVFDYNEGGYDTLLLLMNGIGLCGSVHGLEVFLDHCRVLLNSTGQLLFDSSDVAYFNQEQTDDQYYGELQYRYEYKGQKTAWFGWLYIDPTLLFIIATEKGWSTEILYIDENDQYLARLRPL